MHLSARALALALAAGPAVLASKTDPAQHLARVRLIVTTTSGDTALTIAGAALASYNSAVLDGPPGVRTSHAGLTLAFGGNTRGRSAEARFDVVLANVPSNPGVDWNISADAGETTSLEVYSMNDPDRPQLVDRFSTRAAQTTFTTEATLLDAHGSVRVTPIGPQLVLAQFYPWYTLASWNSPQLGDRPAKPYATDNVSDVRALAGEARGAGIDAFVMSWAGMETSDLPDRQLRLMLDAAQPTGLKVCAFTETYNANRDDNHDAPKDPQVMLDWLVHLTDTFGSHPAYLKVGNRPVILVYTASLFDFETWTDIVSRLRAGGRNPVLIGDFYHSRLIEPLDGEYQYTNITLTPVDLATVYRTETLRVRTFNLLTPGDRRRIWVASVTPGYDDSRLADRPTHIVIDRAGGKTYDDQWAIAVQMAPDWVIITSWNEWYENTEIEPGGRYGTLFLEKTRVWTRKFRPPPRERVQR